MTTRPLRHACPKCSEPIDDPQHPCSNCHLDFESARPVALSYAVFSLALLFMTALITTLNFLILQNGITIAQIIGVLFFTVLIVIFGDAFLYYCKRRIELQVLSLPSSGEELSNYPRSPAPIDVRRDRSTRMTALSFSIVLSICYLLMIAFSITMWGEGILVFIALVFAVLSVRIKQ